MQINGLNQDRYLIDAPIWIDITNLSAPTLFVNVSISDITNPLTPVVSNTLRLHNFGTSINNIRLDEFVKGNFNEPIHPTTSLSQDQSLGINYARMAITFTEVYSGNSFGSTTTVTKNFVRGARNLASSNQIVNVGATLSETEKVLRWQGFPARRYYMAEDNTIKVQSVIDSVYIEDMFVRNPCDSIYVRFMNRLGGYDFWLFETSKSKSSSKSLGIVERRNAFLDLGTEESYEFEVKSKFPISKIAIAEALVVSPDVYVYEKFGQTWLKVKSDNNSVEFKNYDTFVDVSIKLKPYLKISRKVVV